MVPMTTLNGGAGSLPLGQQLHGKKAMRPPRRLVPCAPARGPTAPVTGTLFPRCPKTPPPAQQSGASSHHSPPDDAAPPPHQGDATIVEGPAKFSGRLSQQHEALSVRDDLGSVEGLKGDTKSCSQQSNHLVSALPSTHHRCQQGPGRGKALDQAWEPGWAPPPPCAMVCSPARLPAPTAFHGTNNGYCQGQGPTFRMSSRNDFLSPLNWIF